VTEELGIDKSTFAHAGKYDVLLDYELITWRLEKTVKINYTQIKMNKDRSMQL
jgi:hypothetical protein